MDEVERLKTQSDRLGTIRELLRIAISLCMEPDRNPGVDDDVTRSVRDAMDCIDLKGVGR